VDGGAGMTRKLTYGQAFNEAVRQEMAASDDVFCAGEDIGAFGGVFQTYAGLQAEFGERRVVDTPISEQAIIGLGVGAAVTGLRPIVDIMFMDFLCVAFDQIVNQAAKLKYMFGGAATIPLTITTGGGGGLNLNLPETPFGWDISTRNWLYYEAWVTAGILFLLAWLLVRGRIGRAWRSIRDGEVAAVSAGVNPALYKTFAFGVSSFYAGAAGALFAIETAYVNPDTFPVSLSILLLAAAVIGGLGSLAGVVFGALLFEFLPIYSQEPPLFDLSLGDQAPAVVFGVFLIVVMLLLPGGVAGLFRALANVVRGGRLRRAAPPGA
jgi:ABC-type branched-subunit amino acid transport system permease subunit